MPVRLGELLIKGGLLTPQQVEEALKYQVIFGGRLGTNIIEMGLLSESQIARELSRKLGVPYVNPDHLMAIPPKVIEMIPAELAGKYRVVPLRRDNRRLFVATADPTDYRAIEEIAFRTGFVIKPVVTPELRLTLALEKYYRIPRERRYIATRSSTAALASTAPAAHPTPAVKAEDDTWYAEIETLLPATDTGRELEKVLDELAWAKNRDDIAESLTRYLAKKHNRAALFLIRGDEVLGWKGIREGVPLTFFDRIRIRLAEPSAFNSITEGNPFYLGPLDESPTHARLISAFGGPPPEQVLLVPLKMLGRPVGIIYLDANLSDPKEALQGLKNLAAKAAMAFEILILRNKILML